MDSLHLPQNDLQVTSPLAGRSILIIVENLPVPFDRRVWNEARALHAAGAEVSIICPTGKGYQQRNEEIEGIHIYRHPLPPDATNAIGYLLEYASALFWESLLAWRIFFRRKFDVIHGCNPPDLIFLVALPFKLFGVRFLFDHHDINPELYEAKFGKRGLFWRLMTILERFTFWSANVSIATNESYRKIALERGRMKPDDVFVVRSGPDLTRIELVPPNNAWKNGRSFMVGYVGVMGDQEGIDLLIEAAHHIAHRLHRADVQFCLVGGGPSLDQLKSLAEKKGVSDYFTFCGRVPDKDLFEVLSTADVCVNPDRVNAMNDKSTMNKIMEYMAFGKPIVQFDVTEGKFSAQDASLYARVNDPIDLAEKIIELLEDPEKRTRMGEFGRTRVQRDLNWELSIPSLIAAYQRVLR